MYVGDVVMYDSDSLIAIVARLDFESAEYYDTDLLWQQADYVMGETGVNTAYLPVVHDKYIKVIRSQ